MTKRAVHLLGLLALLFSACSTGAPPQDREPDSQSPTESDRTLEGWDGPVAMPSMNRTELPTQTSPPDPLSLTESKWILKTLGGLPIISGTHLTLTVGADGFSIYDGCNSGASQIEAPPVDPDGWMWFSPTEFLQTLMECTEPEGIMYQASRYKGALG